MRSQLKHQKLRVGSCMEEVLKWFNYPRARAYSGCKVSSQGVPNRLASLLCPCFVKASLTGKKAVLCYKADRLVASLPSFHSIQSSLAVREFHAAGKEQCNKATDGCVRTSSLMSWHPKCIRTITATQQTYLRIHTNLAW